MLKNAPSGIETCAPKLLEMESSRVIITYQLCLKGLGLDVTERSGKGKFKGKAWGLEGKKNSGGPKKKHPRACLVEKKGDYSERKHKDFLIFR